MEFGLDGCDWTLLLLPLLALMALVGGGIYLRQRSGESLAQSIAQSIVQTIGRRAEGNTSPSRNPKKPARKGFEKVVASRETPSGSLDAAVDEEKALVSSDHERAKKASKHKSKSSRGAGADGARELDLAFAAWLRSAVMNPVAES